VKRCTRNNKEGYLEQAIPNQLSRRKKSRVPKALPPEVRQIEEMHLIGVEKCHIDPAELTVDRLMQGRDEQKLLFSVIILLRPCYFCVCHEP
jgi:hypothetical protein